MNNNPSSPSIPIAPASASKKLHGLDHLRALAIAMVFLFHYFILSGGQPTWLPTVASFGWTGVDLFFVLSGFLIASQLFSQIKSTGDISLKEFYVRRFFRILPAYLVTVGLYFCLPLFREKETLSPLWKFLTFTQNFGLDLKNRGTFSHAWSLCVEEHFYLLLPLLLLFLQSSKRFKRWGGILALIFFTGFLIRLYCYQALFLPQQEDPGSGIVWYKQIYYPTYNRLDGLLTGVSIAALYQFRPAFWSRISTYGNLFIILGLLLLTCAYFLCIDQQSFSASVFGFPLISLGYGFMVAGAVCPSSFLFKWESKASTLIATLSYAIYLTHKGIIHITRHLSESLHLNEAVVLLICMLSCGLGAYILNRSVEKPFMKMRDQIIRVRRTRISKVNLTEVTADLDQAQQGVDLIAQHNSPSEGM